MEVEHGVARHIVLRVTGGFPMMMGVLLTSDRHYLLDFFLLTWRRSERAELREQRVDRSELHISMLSSGEIDRHHPHHDAECIADDFVDEGEVLV